LARFVELEDNMDNDIDNDASGEATDDSTGGVSKKSGRTTRGSPKSLSEPLRAAVEVTAPLLILRPDLFAEALGDLFSTAAGRAESEGKGMIYVPGLPFMYRDPEARASHLFDDLAGLCWPCTKGELERARLRKVFAEGWASGDLRFLAEVTFEQLDEHREELAEFVGATALNDALTLYGQV
jgi:hypothetical protein